MKELSLCGTVMFLTGLNTPSSDPLKTSDPHEVVHIELVMVGDLEAPW